MFYNFTYLYFYLFLFLFFKYFPDPKNTPKISTPDRILKPTDFEGHIYIYIHTHTRHLFLGMGHVFQGWVTFFIKSRGSKKIKKGVKKMKKGSKSVPDDFGVKKGSKRTKKTSKTGGVENRPH